MMLFLVLALTGIGAATAVCTAYSRAIEHVRSRTRRLAQYLPPSVADTVLRRGEDTPTAQSFDDVTVAVFRVNNFTQMLDQASPERALRFTNECHLLWGTAVSHNGGTIERLLDDGIVAVFGVRASEPPDHRYRAIRAGLEAARMFATMKPRWEADGIRAFRLGVGIHGGPAVFGDVGFGSRRAYALVGRTLVVARRLQELTQEIYASVVASDAAFDDVRERFNALQIPNVPIKLADDVEAIHIVRGLRTGEEVEDAGMPTMPVMATKLEAPRPVAARQPAEEPVQPQTVRLPVRAALDRTLYDPPVMPEPLWPATYEDGSGPPFRLRS